MTGDELLAAVQAELAEWRIRREFGMMHFYPPKYKGEQGAVLALVYDDGTVESVDHSIECDDSGFSKFVQDLWKQRVIDTINAVHPETLAEHKCLFGGLVPHVRVGHHIDY